MRAMASQLNWKSCWKWVAPLLAAGLPAFAASAEDGGLDFNRDIRPILSNTCFKCHGFDDKTRMADLRLDTVEGTTAKLESGSQAVVPGNSAASELIKRITTSDETLKMPPADSGKTITAEQIELLKKWIDEGATFKQHWSFIPPTRAMPPVVQHADAVRNPIDNFILQKLEKEGLAPSPRADKITLIRRVTLDLTGLPPTPQEVADFVADESPEAYARVVDRLLKSPRYGEHMARYWLDAARYGDTHGLHLDNERSMWPYRDWVVRAFNDNLPFDQFAVWQLAGDLLPEATMDQKVASGFNRCNVTTSEGGSINEEVRVRYAVDRTETTSTVFMGLTLGCAVCHTHKFDPVTQHEFYSLYAFFNQAADDAMDGNAVAPPPIMKLSTPEQQAQLKAFDEQIAAVNKQITDTLASIAYADPATAAPATATGEPAEFVWIDDAAPAGAQLQGNTEWKFVTKADGQVLSGEKATTRKAADLSQHFFTGASPGLKIGEGDKLFAYVYLDPADPPKEIMLQWNDGSWEHRCYWGDDAIPWGGAGSASRLPMGPLPQVGGWVRLEVEAAKVSLAPGATLNGWAFTQFGGTTYWDKAGIVTRTPQEGMGFDSLVAWEAYEKAQTKSAVPAEVKAAINVTADQRNDAQKKQIRDYFLQFVCTTTKPQFDPLKQQADELTKKRTEFDAAIPVSLVMADVPTPRDTFVLLRGAYDKPGDKVVPGVPAVLPPLPEGAPVNRLGLAKWLVDPNHPLTARVTVNRYWQQYFGAGIVKTAEDFGAQGSWPSHPELLDWLARDFIESGWDVKAMQRLIVMSGTYQQASKVTPELLARDPSNELLARGPRFRLDGEVLRDSMLFVSQLLVERPAGKGVKPYQPSGIWESIGFQGSTTLNYSQDKGASLYRRTLYTFWKRTAPPPSMMTFDAPSREACVVRRSRTNTPLQALALMNDVQYVEAARKLAERVMTTGGPTPAERLNLAFQLAAVRQPTADETAILVETWQAHLTKFQADKPSAEKLVSLGESQRNESLDAAELAAYTLACNLILNLDEVVTKE